MTTLREAAQQALDALVSQFDGRADAMNILSAALAQQAEPVEPVAWALHTGTKQGIKWNRRVEHGTPLYTAPPHRMPLTDEDIEQEYKKGYADGYAAGYDNGDSEGFTRGTDSMVPASLAAWRAETKPLTEAQIYAAIKGIDSLKAVEVARAIERAHGITDPQVKDRLARHGIPMPEGDNDE